VNVLFKETFDFGLIILKLFWGNQYNILASPTFNCEFSCPLLPNSCFQGYISNALCVAISGTNQYRSYQKMEEDNPCSLTLNI
jgi:hypothetical protein